MYLYKTTTRLLRSARNDGEETARKNKKKTLLSCQLAIIISTQHDYIKIRGGGFAGSTSPCIFRHIVETSPVKSAAGTVREMRRQSIVAGLSRKLSGCLGGKICAGPEMSSKILSAIRTENSEKVVRVCP